ncbi:hypothetical protein C2S51_020532 [Perilla frutescens var. frutescens]|nr:hypothetical protein C2S51_020532 [Perilla frutescens var. frutescens]
MWTTHDSFISVVRDSWTSNVSAFSKIRLVMMKLKRLKGVLKDLNARVFGNFNVQIASLEQRLTEVQHHISLHGYHDDLADEEISIQADINALLLVKSSHLQQQCRIDWLNDRDRNTKFFHASVKARRAKNMIVAMSINGELEHDQIRIAEHIVAYYKSLFSKEGDQQSVFDELDSLIPTLISDVQRNALVSIPSHVEVKNAVFSLDPNSAAGPDGFTGKFFQEAWEILEKDVYNAVEEFFTFGIIPPGLNSSFLILIPKKNRALAVEDYRPIALSNFLFKIFTKILASRLNDLAAKFVSGNQFGFIQGRQIHDAILLSSEGVNALNQTHNGSNMAIKVDITKAFDTMNWDFLCRVLKRFGFSEKFIITVHNILSSARLSVLVNGSPHGYFACSQGVRQGDPLSPLLFGIAEEVLSYSISKAVDRRLLCPITYVRGTAFPSHILYADDIFLFCQAKRANVKIVAKILTHYASLSGQHCSRLKSRVYFGKGVQPSVKATFDRRLGFTVGSFPTDYLGVPLFKGLPRVVTMRALADKILAKFDRWTGFNLSMAGRLCLLKSVIMSSAIYSMMIYHWPASLVQKLDSAARNFLWKGDVNARSYTVVNWARTCALPEEGDLGLASFTTINRSLLMKAAWKVVTENSSVMKLLRSRFLSHPQHCKRVLYSSVWPGIGPLAKELVRDSFCIIGDGSSVDFWHDNLARHLAFHAYICEGLPGHFA